MSDPTASEIARYARQRGITLTQAMHTLRDEVYQGGQPLPYGRCDVCGGADSPNHHHEVVTETDVVDPEREALSRWLRCDECNDVFQAIDGYAYDDICLRCAMAEAD